MAEVALVAEWRKFLRHFRHMSFYEYSHMSVIFEKKLFVCKLFGLYSENSFIFLDYIPKFYSKNSD